MSANPVARPQSRRGILTAALAGTAAGAAAMAGHVAAAAILPDPAFAAVARAKAKWDAYGEAIRVRDEPETDEERVIPRAECAARVEKAMRAWIKAEDAAFNTVPATPAGMVALLELWWLSHVLDYSKRAADLRRIEEGLEDFSEHRHFKSLIEAGRAFAAMLA